MYDQLKGEESDLKSNIPADSVLTNNLFLQQNITQLRVIRRAFRNDSRSPPPLAAVP